MKKRVRGLGLGLGFLLPCKQTENDQNLKSKLKRNYPISNNSNWYTISMSMVVQENAKATGKQTQKQQQKHIQT